MKQNAYLMDIMFSLYKTSGGIIYSKRQPNGWRFLDFKKLFYNS